MTKNAILVKKKNYIGIYPTNYVLWKTRSIDDKKLTPNFHLTSSFDQGSTKSELLTTNSFRSNRALF